MKKFIPCRKCNGKNGHYPEGFIIEKDSMGNEYIKECQCHVNWTKAESLFIQYQKANGNIQFFNYDINRDYIANNEPVNIINWINTYIEYFSKSERTRAAFCYWVGTNGTQKTTVAYYTLREILSLNYKAKYLLMNYLLKLLIAAERDDEKQEEVEELLNVDLLIIDEAFDLQKSTIYKSNYQIPFLDSFIRNRLNKNKGIIFISNNSLQTLNKDKFGNSLIDLLIRQVSLDKSEVWFSSVYRNHLSKIDDKGLFS
jgi:DNA replication protein DnaC